MTPKDLKVMITLVEKYKKANAVVGLSGSTALSKLELEEEDLNDLGLRGAVDSYFRMKREYLAAELKIIGFTDLNFNQ